MQYNLSHLLLFALLIVCLTFESTRRAFLTRKKADWALDAVSLTSYFVLLPLAQGISAYALLASFAPGLRGSLQLGWVGAFAAHAAIDYAWYWNHRLFHAKTPLWSLHATHHEATQLDMLASQRNSIWSFVFMIYFWAVPVVVYFAKDPAPFFSLGAFAALINFWGHSQLDLPRNSIVYRVFSLFLIQPEDHFWHHSRENTHCNFATVFNFWDRIHGTWYHPGCRPKVLGFEWNVPVWRKIFLPFSE